ncbi:MAG: hypothetical protein Q8Q05_02635 [bacterium]|nr:hypothetical protein [bacterium]
MTKYAESFFDYPHSPFRDESDFAGLFGHACGLLNMLRVKQEAIFIVRRAFARSGTLDEHRPIFALTVELRLEEFKRLGELSEWLQLLEHHTECLVEFGESDTCVTTEGLRYWVVPGATPPVPPTQVTFLEPSSGESRKASRQVARLSQDQVGKEIPRREKEAMGPELETRKPIRVSELELTMIKLIWPLFTGDEKVACSAMVSAALEIGWSTSKANNAIRILRMKGVIVVVEGRGLYGPGASSVTISQRGEPEENWRTVVLADLSEQESSSPAAPPATLNGQVTDQEPEQPPTEATVDSNPSSDVIEALDREEERIKVALAVAVLECKEIKADADERCEVIRVAANERLEAIAKTRQVMATPFPS